MTQTEAETKIGKMFYRGYAQSHISEVTDQLVYCVGSLYSYEPEGSGPSWESAFEDMKKDPRYDHGKFRYMKI